MAWCCLRGVLAVRHVYGRSMATKVGIVGVPFGKGHTYRGKGGVEMGPDAIRSVITNDIKAMGIDLKDYGQVSYTPLSDSGDAIKSLNNFNHVIPNMIATSNAVANVLKDGRTCVVLGGDHSIFTGSAHGHLQEKGDEDVAVVYVDAHADFHGSDTSPSGNIHGMGVSAVTKEHHGSWAHIPRMDWIKHKFPARNLAYIGLRALEDAEILAIQKHNVAAFTMMDVVENGIAEVIKQALKRVDPDGTKSIHLSIDTDSLDPSEAPCTTVPERGGLSLRELLYLVAKVRDTGRISVVDLVELNPTIGTEEEKKRTLHAGKLALLTALGRVAVPSVP